MVDIIVVVVVEEVVVGWIVVEVVEVVVVGINVVDVVEVVGCIVVVVDRGVLGLICMLSMVHLPFSLLAENLVIQQPTSRGYSCWAFKFIVYL